MNTVIKLSIIVPIWDEAENLNRLHEEIVAMCLDPKGCDLSFDGEIIFIDDGSEDGTREVCCGLYPLRYIRLARNYGQTAALDCGFKAATGDYVAALDGDGQNDPADIPFMLQYLEDHDLDVVCGWRTHRQDSLRKRVASRAAEALRRGMVQDGIHDSGCTLKVFRRECLEGLTLYGDQHRFIPAILKDRGWRVGEVEVHHRPREHGKSKYNFTRFYKGLRDLTEIRMERNSGRFSRTMTKAYHTWFGRRTYRIAEQFENIGGE